MSIKNINHGDSRQNITLRLPQCVITFIWLGVAVEVVLLGLLIDFARVMYPDPCVPALPEEATPDESIRDEEEYIR